MKFFASTLLFIFLLPSQAVKAQIKKGQFIVATEYPNAVIYIDTMRIMGHGTGLLAPGTYKVRAWRLGTELYESEIRIKKDSISILKIRFVETPDYLKYKQSMRLYQRRRWLPKLALLGYSIALGINMQRQSKIGNQALAEYQTNYFNYQSVTTLSEINKYRALTQESYNTYHKAYRSQQISILQLKAVPIILAGLITYDLFHKRPAKFKQKPLLTFHAGGNFYNWYSFQLAYHF